MTRFWEAVRCSSMKTVVDNQGAKKQAYVFPGQGSQSVGMGWELFCASPAAKEVFREADDSLGCDLSGLIFNGPGPELQDTINSQPAIMTVSIAAWKAWEEMAGPAAPEPAVLAGHSLGEYTAMVVADVVEFKDAVTLARERGRLMQQASKDHPGSMAAVIGLNEFALEQICSETGVELANINSDDQIVISGDKMAVARAVDLAFARGAKRTIPLPVSGAFHSSCMQDARVGLTHAVDALHFRDPQIPIIANSDCSTLTTGDAVREELIQGLCRCVHWKENVRYMVASGVSQFLEFGPAGVLAGLIKRIDRGVEAVALSDPESISKLTSDAA